MPNVPAARPELTADGVRELARLAGLDAATFVLGRRGYYRDSLGVTGRNDRGIYDDAIFVVSPTVFAAFNANTDPSRDRPGMAQLRCGVYQYKLGIHNISKDPALHPHYEALVQAGPVTVDRDGGGSETGWFGINIHRGSLSTTSSEGCQTLYPTQYDEFLATVKRVIATTIPYVLTEHA